MRRCFLLLVVFVCLPLFANAQAYIIQVPSGGDIQTAINQAAGIISGPTPSDVIIEVAPGTYTPSSQLNVNAISSPTYTVTLRGIAGPSATLIDLTNVAVNAVRGDGTQNLIVEGFTFRNRSNPFVNFTGRGIYLFNATNIIIQNCHFDTTQQSIQFNYQGPGGAAMSPQLQVIHNTAVAGDCPDPASELCLAGQAVTLQYTFPEGTVVTGEPRMTVADNVFVTSASCVRFIVNITDPTNGAITQALPNGSLTMTGNDVTSTALGAGHNVIGGRGHYVAGNRFHDGHVGATFQLVYSYTFENNLVYGNSVGVNLAEGNMAPAPPLATDHRYIRHNTIVNNRGMGIVYQDGDGGEHLGIPNVYNNIIAFNDAGGVTATENFPGTFRVISADFQMSRNDVYGNTLRNMYMEHDWFSYVGINNPEAIKPDYSGVIKTGEDLSVVLGFMSAEDLDFALKKNSPLQDMGLTTRPTPLRDLFGAMRDAKPDVGAAEVVPMPNVNLRSNPMRKGPPPID